MEKSIRTTIIGGVVFLVPIVIVLMILRHAYEIAVKLATPISRLMPIDSFVGLAAANILAGIMIVALCYCAGHLARSSAVGRRVARLDQFLATAVPVYNETKKGVVNTVARRSFEDDWKVVLVGDAGERRWLGFEVETLENGEIAVFQPLSPNTTNGFVWTVPEHQVERLDLAPRRLSELLRSHGIGVSRAVGKPR